MINKLLGNISVLTSTDATIGIIINN